MLRGRDMREARAVVQHRREKCVMVELVCKACSKVEEWPIPLDAHVGRATCTCGGQLVEAEDLAHGPPVADTAHEVAEGA